MFLFYYIRNFYIYKKVNIIKIICSYLEINKLYNLINI